MQFGISRRAFIKMAGTAAVGLAAGIPAVPGEAGSWGKILYAGREIPLLYQADVCIVGGGPAGVAAAVSAGKKGVKNGISGAQYYAGRTTDTRKCHSLYEKFCAG